MIYRINKMMKLISYKEVYQEKKKCYKRLILKKATIINNCNKK